MDAQKLLQKSISVGNNAEYDLFIIDVNSGRQSAIQLYKSISENSEFSRIRIALLSSSDAGLGDVYKDLRCKIFPKNTEMTQLFIELNRFLSTTALAQPKIIHKIIEPSVVIQEEEIEVETGNSKGLVLLVEDNPINLLVAQRLLKLSNFEFVSADNGKVALELLHDNLFDMVLMDCQMPVMDGYQATKAWRLFEAESNSPRRVPIIAMTANAMAEDRQKCLDAGMDDYLSKPVDRKLLKQTLQKWLIFNLSQPEVEQQAKPVVPAEAIQQAPNNEIDASALDFNIVSDLKQFMGSDYQSLIRIYLEDSPKLLQQIQSALFIQDGPALIMPTHTLKSSSANLGAIRLSKLAAKFEASARTGNLEIPNLEAQNLVKEFNSVIIALKDLLD
jgi:CheY-like chemotaxis protein/HPt (histidine-containing phosphotransfer) domain-containing protein